MGITRHDRYTLPDTGGQHGYVQTKDKLTEYFIPKKN